MSSISSRTRADPNTGRPSIRNVLAGSRWQAQNAIRPINANSACLPNMAVALPSVGVRLTLVAE